LNHYKCKCGVSRNRKRVYESPLVKLVELVHELSGMPVLPQGRSWRDRAERLSSPSYRNGVVGNGEYETGLDDPIAAGDDPELDALVEAVLKSWGY